MELVLNCVHHKISNFENEVLFKKVFQGEVKKAIFSMHSDKSTRTNGLNPVFLASLLGPLGL